MLGECLWGPVRVRGVQSGLVLAIQTATHSIHSSSQQGPAIWTRFCSDRAAHKVPSVWGLHSQWAPGMCWTGREPSRFKGWRHSAIYLFTPYTGACHFINICISFLAPWSVLGSVSLVFGTKINLKSLYCFTPLSHVGHKHMLNIKYDLYTGMWCIYNSLKLVLLQVQTVI